VSDARTKAVQNAIHGQRWRYRTLCFFMVRDGKRALSTLVARFKSFEVKGLGKNRAGGRDHPIRGGATLPGGLGERPEPPFIS
jgi:hypothetical protein